MCAEASDVVERAVRGTRLRWGAQGRRAAQDAEAAHGAQA